MVEHEGDWWFVAKDVCKVLGYTNSRKAITDHCKAIDGVTIRDSIGREQKTTIIPERDLYRLIMRSKLPAAEKFENWVVSEVLPSVRKHGVYMSRDDRTTNPVTGTRRVASGMLMLPLRGGCLPDEKVIITIVGV
jgi:prophage antirepressor-like protein